jgi:hypothetical protein
MRFHDDAKVARVDYTELVAILMNQVEGPHEPFIIYLEFDVRDDLIAAELKGVPNVFGYSYSRREDRELIAARD